MFLMTGCLAKEADDMQRIIVEESQEAAVIDEVNTEHFYFTSPNGEDYTRYRFEYPKPKDDENAHVVAARTHVDELTLVSSIEEKTGWNLGVWSVRLVKDTENYILVTITADSDIYKDTAGRGEYRLEDHKTVVKTLLGCVAKTVVSESQLAGQEKELPVYFVDEAEQAIVFDDLPEYDGTKPFSLEW